MNYIAKLQAEIKRLKQEKNDAANQLDELRIYLQSQKFHDNTMVQVKDVLTRLPYLYEV